MINTSTFINTKERKMFIILSVGILLSIFLYIFFIGIMSVSAVTMSGAETQIRMSSAHISELEEEYMKLTGDVTLSYAYSRGFEEPVKVTFATRKTFAVNFGDER